MNTNWSLSFRLWFLSVMLFDIAALCYIRYENVLQLDPAFISLFIFFVSAVLSLPVLFIYMIALPIIKRKDGYSDQKLKGILLLNSVLAAIYTIALVIVFRNEPGGPDTLRYVFVFITLFASSAGSLLINQTLLEEYFLGFNQKEIEQ